jgi:ubiquinone/menaquinone biosynthesis C-methylase UbiE
VKVDWDYSSFAANYDKRADYSPDALDRLASDIGLRPGGRIADLGAGTAKLAAALARRAYVVDAVEPNDEMRRFGVANTRGLAVTWHEGTGEVTGLPDHSFDLVTFGSSFNVVDQAKTLVEVARILKPRGWMACMWNHRDLEDATQAAVEATISAAIPGYRYGTRREDPTPVIDASQLFAPVRHIVERFTVDVATDDYVAAWRSHATLGRQAGDKFASIIDHIQKQVGNAPTLTVPFRTRLWYAQLL